VDCGVGSNLLLAGVQDGLQVPTSVNNSFNADRVSVDAKKNQILPYHGNPCIRADLRTKAIEFGLAGNRLHFGTQIAQQTHRVTWAVCRNEVGDLFQVVWHARRKAEQHY